MERENVWKKYDAAALVELDELSAKYKLFLDNGKTERECVKQAVELAKQNGYRSLDSFVEQEEPICEGTKLYVDCMGKAIMLFVIGKQPIQKGMNIVGAHIDSPRMDLKQNPLYEDGDIAYMDTHYYGGIKKYQWVTIPLAIHGVVVKKDGTVTRPRFAACPPSFWRI